MKIKNTESLVYLVSQSESRKRLMEEAQIPFEIVGHTADEHVSDWSVSLDSIVQSIARQKMDSVAVPVMRDGEQAIFLTADTLVQSSISGKVFGKPVDYEDAVVTLKSLKGGVRVVTAFCCEKKEWIDGSLKTIASIEQVVDGQAEVSIPDSWIAAYLERHPCALQTAGVLFIEGYGAQFIASVDGSYTAILGLPMLEVRQALEALDFFRQL